LEQQLIVRFAPEWRILAEECDQQPAEFTAGRRHPVVAVRNGTLYARVFPAGQDGRRVEIQYFHLWSRDCGAMPHQFDIEHVSTFVEAPRPGAAAPEWQARYWYAAAHEGTVCDRSHAALAEVLKASGGGARVSISKGKHASFLQESLCAWGCGGDRCDRTQPFTPVRILNLGEPGHPLNGALWIDSPAWSLAAKLKSDFPEALLARLEAGRVTAIAGKDPVLLTTQAVALGVSTAAGAVGSSNRRTADALDQAGGSTGQALGKSAEAVGESLAKSAEGVGKSVTKSTEHVGMALGKAGRGMVRFLAGKR
jgi:hypothetical protein